MKKQIVILAGLSMMFASCNSFGQDKFSKTPGGLEYKFVKKGTGTYTPQAGDMTELSVVYKIGDSTLFSTAKMNDNKPVPNVCQAPKYPGDLSEGLMMMKSGDSAVFRMPLDSFSKHTGTPMPPFAKSGEFVTWEVKMFSVKNKAEYEKEQGMAAEAQIKKDELLIQEYIKKNNLKAQKTASGLYYVIEGGSGESPASGKKVTVNYTGMLLDGSKFDSNIDPAFNHVQPFDFPLGQGRVIKGWDEGVALMKKGSKGKLIIPSGLAYGQRSPSPKIPANSVLVFDIDLLSFE